MDQTQLPRADTCHKNLKVSYEPAEESRREMQRKSPTAFNAEPLTLSSYSDAKLYSELTPANRRCGNAETNAAADPLKPPQANTTDSFFTTPWSIHARMCSFLQSAFLPVSIKSNMRSSGNQKNRSRVVLLFITLSLLTLQKPCSPSSSQIVFTVPNSDCRKCKNANMHLLCARHHRSAEYGPSFQPKVQLCNTTEQGGIVCSLHDT